MSDFTLRAMKAKHGDSLLLLTEGATVLIDGGPSGVYNQVLRDVLKELEPDGEDQPRIDLMMVSHIDADHIDGILDLTAELLEAREDERDPIVRIDRAWHNSFTDLMAQSGVETSSQVKASAASVASAFEDLLAPDFDPHESALVLSSVAQGRQLRLDLKALNIDLNRRFKDRVVLQAHAEAPWECGNLKLDVIGPTQRELDKLRVEWAKQLPKILAKEEGAKTAAKGLDTSISNLASIVAIADVNGKTVLLTGDARGDMVLEWLEQTGHLAAGSTMHFDVIKLPHHGSDRNIDPVFFERLTADHYLVCGNGKHGNPEPGTLEMLFTARPDDDYMIHMTYGPEELKEHKSFKKHGNVEKLDAVLTDPARAKKIIFPDQDSEYIDIEV